MSCPSFLFRNNPLYSYPPIILLSSVILLISVSFHRSFSIGNPIPIAAAGGRGGQGVVDQAAAGDSSAMFLPRDLRLYEGGDGMNWTFGSNLGGQISRRPSLLAPDKLSSSNYRPKPFPSSSRFYHRQHLQQQQQQQQQQRHNKNPLRQQTPLEKQQQKELSSIPFHQLSRMAFKALKPKNRKKNTEENEENNEPRAWYPSSSSSSSFNTQTLDDINNTDNDNDNLAIITTSRRTKNFHENYFKRKFGGPLRHHHKNNRRKHRKKSRKGRRKKNKPSKSTYPDRREALVIASKNGGGLLRADQAQQEQCTTQLFKQKVRADGCLPKIVVNRFCYGHCPSFFIPKLRRHRLQATFSSCAACMPIDYTPVTITMNCPGLPPGNRRLRRTVMKVKRCTCKAIQIPQDQL